MTKRQLRNGVMFLFLITFFLQTISRANSLQADTTSVNKVAAAQMDISQMPAMLHQELTGKNVPATLTTTDNMKKRMCRGEFEALSLFLQPKEQVNNVRFSWNDFTSKEGNIIAKSELDISIVKVWYQAGVLSDETTKKRLTQELLIKNDNLIKVDYNTQTNYLLVNKNGSDVYQNISDPNATFPSDAKVMDSETLQPINLDGTTNRQMWLTIHVPDDSPAGTYTTQLTISSDLGVIKIIPIEIEVLPFNLDKSRLTYSMYYHGIIDQSNWKPYSYYLKTPDQARRELKDLKDHGIMYPTFYQTLKYADQDLQIRKELGFPTDRLFTLGLETGNPQSTTDLNNLKAQVKQWKDKAAQYGYKELYVYGIDEAQGDRLTSQRPAWNAVHEAGAKVFVAGYTSYFNLMGDLLDVANILGTLRPDQADQYHSKGHQIFSYSNPQVGQENPELYRRNYGLSLWKAGYDGAMNYAYQKYYNSEWNDFDNKAYREETFSYLTSNGIIKTIGWEGFREAVDDVRYLSTLLNRIDQLKAKGVNVAAAESFVKSIDPAQDLDGIRSQIIDQILSLNNMSTTGTESSKSTSLLKDYVLEQNYPNPFNPSTTIKFTLPEKADVSLKIYDMLGKEVATLVNGEMQMGSHEVSFNANNLATGMYVYEIKAGNFTQNKKMMLMK